MKIVAMLRIKNEARWLREVLLSIHPLTKEITIFDDHSTDESVLIAESLGAKVIHSEFPPNDTDEARDKNLLLAAVRATSPEYVLSIDGDEVLSAGAAEKILAQLSPRNALYCFPFKYLWNDREHYRADGVYGDYHQWRMFSLIRQPEKLWFSSKSGGSFHCGNTPKGLIGSGIMVQADILHLGYMDQEDRLRKFAWYNRIDPNNSAEDRYRHMVIGDLFSESSQFVHGGPLKVFRLAAGLWPEMG